MGSNRREYTAGEEIANSVSHGVGGLLAVAELILLVVLSALHGNTWHIVGCTIYGMSLVALFFSSTLYHSIRAEGAKRVLKVMDHSAIYLLIAGTYTPFVLVYLRSPIGVLLLLIVWGGFFFGTLWKVFSAGRFGFISTVIYLLMGWCILLAIKPVIETVPSDAIFLVLFGGILYSLGVPFYAVKEIPFNHAMWHMFVLAGSLLQFLAVLFYVIPLH